MKKIKDLEAKQKCEALTNFYNQCHPLNYNTSIFMVMELKIDAAFTFDETKQGKDYWLKVGKNV
tara:strand:- start:199 stop:390 length:192 start_codon:yes stop_codon:yes gene_type:complete